MRLRVRSGPSRVKRFVLAVHDHGNDLLHHEAQIDRKGVAAAGQQFRACDGRLVDVGMAVVILQERDGLIERRPRHEDDATEW